MGSQGCRDCVAFVLKLLNFGQGFIGVAMILYAAWMQNQWNSRVRPALPLAIAPATASYDFDLLILRLEDSVLKPRSITGADRVPLRKLALDQFAVAEGFDLKGVKLPEPWHFLCCFL